MDSRLIMRFTTQEDGKYFTLSLDNLKVDPATGNPSVTEAEVNTLMDLLIQKNIFSTYGALVAKKDARIVSTTEQAFNMA